MRDRAVSQERSLEVTPCPVKRGLSHRLAFCALVVAAILWPNTAHANAGTPLMWAGFLHLFLGNLFIGLAEGCLLVAIFKAPAPSWILVMIGANYFSAWLGGLLFIPRISRSLALDLCNVGFWLWVMVAVTYLVTFLLEWPFVAFCLRKNRRWFLKSIYGSAIIQTLTYLAIFGWYWGASGTSLFTSMTIVEPREILMPDGVLYYISDSDGGVYSLELNSGETSKVAELNSASENDRLLFRQRGPDSGEWNLVARLETAGSPRLETVRAGVSGRTASARGDADTVPEGSWFNFGEVPRIGPVKKDSWEFSSGFYPIEGIQGIHPDGRTLRFSLETPFVEWAARNAVQLPDDKVILQLGTRQICLVDPDRRAIALLARGRGPAVIVRQTSGGEGKESDKAVGQYQ